MTPTNYNAIIDSITGEIVITWFDGEDTLERRLIAPAAPYTIVWMPDQNDWAIHVDDLPFGSIPFSARFRD